MDGNESSANEIKVIFSRPFLGACGIIVALCGYVIGLWATAIEQDRQETRVAITDIRRILDERATLTTRTAELERRTEDQEQRLRVNEWHLYSNGHK